MRLLLAIVLVASAGCSSTARGAGGEVYSSSSTPLKPGTIAGCNGVNLKVELTAEGIIRVNGEQSSMEGLKEAALRKDAACQNAAAMVVYSYDAESPGETRDAIKLLLKQTIVNLSLIEAGQG